ncbi:MAG: AtpZ/AtpI family protein [Cytophagales bacterium]|nr:MAG: AtpZ/AtpI family protein [Cytophagales bacterium]
MKTAPKPQKYLNTYLRFSGLAFQMLFIILLSTWAGLSLDKYWQLKTPIFTLILVLSGIIGTMIWLILTIQKQD